jgi:ribosomal protein S12
MNCPQRGGICQKVTTISPKKPCSGNRAVAYVRFRRRYRAQFYVICRIRGSKKV